MVLPGNTLNTSSTSPPEAQPSFHFSKRQSIGLVFGCTILGATAQILMKMGANTLVTKNPIDILTNPPLFAGYCLYGLSTILLVLALRDGELSILYPVISLTFAWVTVLSVLIFHDALNVYKVAGILVIILGVGVLGMGSRT